MPKTVVIEPKEHKVISKKQTGQNFASLFDERGMPDMFPNVDVDDPLQKMADAEVQDIGAAIKAEYKGDYERYRTNASPFFFLCVCFQNEEQKNEFLKKSGWETAGAEEIYHQQYLDGLEIAKRLGIEILSVEFKLRPPAKSSKLTKKEVR